MRRVAVIFAVLLGMLLATTVARASTIVYQCGQGVCAVDPATAQPQPHQLTADARLAGLTRDGTTVAWVDAAGNLDKVPLAGGSPQTVYTGAVGNQPVMSPDGSQFLWWQIGPGPILGYTDVYVYRFVVGSAGPVGVSNCTCTTTHGWVGSTPVAAFPSQPDHVPPIPSQICTLASGAGSSCVRVVAADTRGELAWPSGSPDGSLIVASLHRPAGDDTHFDGGISLYSAATGGVAKDVTPGPSDIEPQFSPDGKAIVFDRGGQIVTRDLTTGAEKALATGTYPFWGAAGGSSGPSPPPMPAPTPISTPTVRSAAALRVAGATLRGGRLTGSATLPSAANGARVRITVLAARHRARFTVRVARGRLRFSHRLAPNQRRARTALLTYAYPGGRSLRPSSVQLVAARGAAALRQRGVRLHAGRLTVSGTISRRARGRLSLALSYSASGKAETWRRTVAIKRGRWSLGARPPRSARGGGVLTIAYRGDQRRGIRGEQLAGRIKPR